MLSIALIAERAVLMNMLRTLLKCNNTKHIKDYVNYVNSTDPTKANDKINLI